MKKALLLFLPLVFFLSNASAQQFEWASSNAVDYNLNPGLPSSAVAVSTTGGVYTSYTDSVSVIYGSDVYGKMKVSSYDVTGNLQWTTVLSDFVHIRELVSDGNGNVYVAGSYLDDILINGTNELTHIGGVFEPDLFVLSLHADGTLSWTRDITLTHPDYFTIEALTIDHQDNLWYAVSDFFKSAIYKTDASGNDLFSYEMQGAKTIGGFSFNGEGSVYISGAAGLPSITVAGYTKPVTEPYMMFATRINAAGNASWVQLATDVTFQTPQVKTDPWGNAYVSGSLFTATTFGTVSFISPQWLYDIFLTRVDSNGNFQWGVQAPQSSSGITGDFSRGTNNFMEVSDNGNVYIEGITRGTLDWGNGVISGGGAISLGILSVLSFDTLGNSLWAVNGGSASFNEAQSIAVDEDDNCFFSQSIIDGATYGTITINIGGGYASVVGKINSSIATSVTEIPGAPSMSIYPNPSTDVINVEVNSEVETFDIHLVDISGKIIPGISAASDPGGKNTFHFSTKNLQAGMYFVQLKTSGATFNQKLIIE
jgi:hypothetical protein